MPEEHREESRPPHGNGATGFRPDFAVAFFEGVFTDKGAKEAPVFFKKVVLLHLTAEVPPWMRLRPGGGALTPISKEKFAPGGDPDARPVKAEDLDTGAWTSALARTAASTARDTA